MYRIRFAIVFLFGGILILAQAVFSFQDGYFSTAQMLQVGHEGYAFLQDGGVWADLFLITPIVSYLVGKYRFAYFSTRGIAILIVALILWVLLAVFLYAPAGVATPAALVHGGYVTLAGWIHVLYATLMMWVIAMMYIPGLVMSPVSKKDIVIVSGLLIPWAILGVMKFSHVWQWDLFSTTQVTVEIIGIGALAYLRLRCR